MWDVAPACGSLKSTYSPSSSAPSSSPTCIPTRSRTLSISCNCAGTTWARSWTSAPTDPVSNSALDYHSSPDIVVLPQGPQPWDTGMPNEGGPLGGAAAGHLRPRRARRLDHGAPPAHNLAQ